MAKNKFYKNRSTPLSTKALDQATDDTHYIKIKIKNKKLPIIYKFILCIYKNRVSTQFHVLCGSRNLDVEISTFEYYSAKQNYRFSYRR